MATDTAREILGAHVHAANRAETIEGCILADLVLPSPPSVKACCADSGYRGTFAGHLAQEYDLPVHITAKPGKTFKLQAERWVAERTFGWQNGDRRPGKDYAKKTAHPEAMIRLRRLSSGESQGNLDAAEYGMLEPMKPTQSHNTRRVGYLRLLIGLLAMTLAPASCELDDEHKARQSHPAQTFNQVLVEPSDMGVTAYFAIADSPKGTRTSMLFVANTTLVVSIPSWELSTAKGPSYRSKKGEGVTVHPGNPELLPVECPADVIGALEDALDASHGFVPPTRGVVLKLRGVLHH